MLERRLAVAAALRSQASEQVQHLARASTRMALLLRHHGIGVQTPAQHYPQGLCSLIMGIPCTVGRRSPKDECACLSLEDRHAIAPECLEKHIEVPLARVLSSSPFAANQVLPCTPEETTPTGHSQPRPDEPSSQAVVHELSPRLELVASQSSRPGAQAAGSSSRQQNSLDHASGPTTHNDPFSTLFMEEPWQRGVRLEASRRLARSLELPDIESLAKYRVPCRWRSVTLSDSLCQGTLFRLSLDSDAPDAPDGVRPGAEGNVQMTFDAVRKALVAFKLYRSEAPDECDAVPAQISTRGGLVEIVDFGDTRISHPAARWRSARNPDRDVFAVVRLSSGFRDLRAGVEGVALQSRGGDKRSFAYFVAFGASSREGHWIDHTLLQVQRPVF